MPLILRIDGVRAVIQYDTVLYEIAGLTASLEMLDDHGILASRGSSHDAFFHFYCRDAGSCTSVCSFLAAS
jgi:hypothetical protein